MRKFLALPVAAVLVLPVIAEAKERRLTTLQRQGGWIANYDDDSCQLVAKFGSGDEAVIARFTRYQPGDRFDLTLYGERLKRAGARVPIKVAFAPGQPEREVEAVVGDSNKKPLLLMNSMRLDGWTPPKGDWEAIPPPIGPEQEVSVTGFTFWLNRSTGYTLALGPMGKPMQAMRTCMDNLLQHWGYDPAVIAAQSKAPKPIGSPGNWLTTVDYPSASLMRGHNGIVQFRLDLDEAGKILGCHILARTNPDEFADVSCRALTRRAKFEPALDATGKAMKSFYISKIRFIIPE